MSRTVRLSGFLAMLGLALLLGLQGACGGGGGSSAAPPPPPPPAAAPSLSAITLTPAARAIAAGTDLQFAATGFYSDGSRADLTASAAWQSDNAAAATVSASGLAHGVALGTTTIRATQDAVTATATLSVSAATLVSISVSPVAPSLPRGLTLVFTATGTFTDGSKQDLTGQVAWTTSDAAIAAVSAQGLASAAAAGTVTLRATLGPVAGAASLTVTSPVLQQIAVSPALLELPKGMARQCSAQGLYSDGSKQDLTTQVAWTSTRPEVARVDAAGLATGLAPGRADLEAALGAIRGAASLTVTPATLASLAVDPPAPVLPLGVQQQMTATGVFSDQSILDLTRAVAWTSSAPAVASVDGAGLATAASPGTATLAAALGAHQGSALATVTQPVLTGIGVFGPSPLVAGTTGCFTATAFYSDGSFAEVTDQAAWSCSDPAVALVDTTPGRAGTLVAAGPGAATVTAAFGGMAGTLGVAVNAATLTALVLVPDPGTLAAGSQLAFTATGSFDNGASQDLTSQAAWQSSDPAVLRVSSAAGSEGVATGVAAGAATLSASFRGVTGTAAVQVTAATLTAIAVTPAATVLAKGLTLALTATGTFSDGSTQDLTAQVAWSSSRQTVASVSNRVGQAGTVTALGIGSATLTASLRGVAGQASVTVTNVTLVAIDLTPADSTVQRGTSVRFAATGRFSDGSTAKMTNVVAWSSSNPAIANINPSKKGGAGKCVALARGSVTISATRPPQGSTPAMTGTTSLTVH